MVAGGGAIKTSLQDNQPTVHVGRFQVIVSKH